jgi:hypothetical protein
MASRPSAHDTTSLKHGKTEREPASLMGGICSGTGSVLPLLGATAQRSMVTRGDGWLV